MTAKHYFLRVQETPWKSIDGKEGVLLKLKDGTYYTLNEVGLKIWELSDGTRSITEIASKISKEFSIPLNQANKDIKEFVAQLKKEELIVERSKPLKK